MADIERSGPPDDVVLTNPELKKQWLQIKLNEKKVQLKQLEVHIDRVQNIELPKQIHARDKCKKELDILSEKINKMFIEIGYDKKKGGK
jgi:hypothetical protein